MWLRHDWDVSAASSWPFSFPYFLPPGPSFVTDFILGLDCVSWLVREVDELAAPPMNLFGYLWISVIHWLPNADCTIKGPVSACCGGLSSSATLWVLSILLPAQLGEKRSWGRKSQKPWESGISGMASQNWFQHCLVAWSLAEGFFCYAFWLAHPPPSFKFVLFFFFLRGLFYCILKIFFFFLPCTKYWLMLLIAVCWLYVSFYRFKIDHFCVGFYFKPE